MGDPDGKDGSRGGSDSGASAAPSTDAPSARVGGKRKLTRTALTLREKAIVKSFCEQKVADCKARSELVPSQEVLRREVAAQFGWSCGRSTLSKIISMDWKLLRSGEQGGDAPRNPDMKRRRRPLFPAFEADLVKFIAAHIDAAKGSEHVAAGAGETSVAGVAGSPAADRDVDSGRGSQRQSDQPSGGSRTLTEALILEEAQRLKQEHGVSDDMLVLSVGWLARFKHRHCIRLRKPAGVSSKSSVPPTTRMVSGTGFESGSLIGWSAGVLVPSLTQPPATKTNSLADAATADAPAHDAGASHLSANQPPHLPLGGDKTSLSSPTPPSKREALCAAQWHREDTSKSSSITVGLLEQIPANIRELACSCQGSAVDDDLNDCIPGMRVAVVGFGSVVKAFLAAALVGAEGLVTCVEASPSNVYMAEQVAEAYCLETLGLPLVNMKFVVGEYGGMSQLSLTSGALNTDGLKSLQGQAELAVCNCSIQSLEFPASKNTLLELAFSLLKVGGELRVTDLVCSRRLSPRECETMRSTMEERCEDFDCASVRVMTKQFQQKLLLNAPYVGDLQRLYRSLSSDIDLRWTRCNEAEATAINGVAGELLPSLPTDNAQFRRVTFRAFKLEDIENPCEDYGQTAIFNGVDACNSKNGDTEMSSRWYRLDDNWLFHKGVSVRVDGNTAQILQASWLHRLFSVSGDRSRHVGLFTTSLQPSGSTNSHGMPTPRSSEDVPVVPSSDSSGAIQSNGIAIPSSEHLEMVDI
ncbi:unnamed protein product [Phytophthora fragariaefolia]|uniref:Unnamed protein product n=1 Tax=Phytophthora fragariaefolia TaxID=1490495 RepID=A0A9W6YLB2_9STRA|nr:unnamed protein product [Phytophthora fragariaefolia]